MTKKYRPGMAVRQLWNQVGLFWRDKVKRSRPSRICFVVSEPRTGSNLLLSYLISHSSIAVTEEVLNPWSSIGFPRNHFFRPFALGHVRRSLALDSRLAVCKLMLHHLRYHAISFSQLADAFPSAFVIVLYRKNLLEQYVSMRRLLMTGVHKLVDGRKVLASPRIVVDVEHFLGWAAAQKRQFTGLIESPLLERPFAVLSYEELVTSPREVVSALFQQLELPDADIHTNMRKQGTDGLRGSVINYSEIEHLIGSEEATMYLAPPESLMS